MKNTMELRSPWIDCNAANHPHEWRRGAVEFYWDCKICPVSTRTQPDHKLHKTGWEEPSGWL